VNLKGAAIQRGPEHGNRRIAIVRGRYHETSSEEREDFMCALLTVQFGVRNSVELL
jgi:hypothetical protein